MSPNTIHCESGSRKSREEYLGEVEFVSGENQLTNLLMRNGIRHDNQSHNTAGNRTENIKNMNGGKDCDSPTKIDGALVYR